MPENFLKKFRFVAFLRLQIHYAQQLGNGGQCHGLQKPYCRGLSGSASKYWLVLVEYCSRLVVIKLDGNMFCFSAQVMVLWTYRGQALYSLLTDVTEGIAGLAVLHGCLSRFYPLPKDWFRFSLKGNWHIDIVLGCLLFPLVNRLSQFNLDLPVQP
ncbi:hypothetical protein QQ045_020583 [Rhodiola kirilowii]